MASRMILVSLLAEKQEFQQLQAEDARQAGARTGFEVQVIWANNNPTAQFQDIMQALSAPEGARPAAVVVEPAAAAGFDGAARAAAQAGVSWIYLTDRPATLERLQREFPNRLIASVGMDNDEVGRLQAKQFRALLPSGGRMVYVEGPSLSFAAMHRRKLMEEGLTGSGIEVVKVLSGDWTEESAERAATRWLKLGAKGDPPLLVGGQNDEMALGVRKAFLALRAEWNHVLFTGVDGLPQGGQRAVREKVLAATIILPPPTGPAVELVSRSQRGEPAAPFTLLPPRPFPAIEELRRA
ncbi:MAG TPA: substrate-binding domain-containing protein [Anaeromyxobacter sp.]|nr:substrate-binding domain-containing protein [Anaeromyxobacter sp.]